MRSSVQETMIQSLAGILRPIVRLMFLCGLGYAEFESVARSVFVQVASAEYGIRGRPTNTSRIAALTGLSRKQVSRIRSEAPLERWSPDMEASPINTVLHYWNFDPDFSEIAGKPRVLPLDGEKSFASLVRKYAGDIPPGALKTDLCRSGVAKESDDRTLSLSKRFYFPSNFHEDYIRNVAFSLRNLGNTLAHNAALVSRESTSEEIHQRSGRFERYAWSQHLPEESIRALQLWARTHGGRFVEEVDHWIGQHETAQTAWESAESKIAGVGVYFFIDE